MITGIKLLGLYFLVLGARSTIEYSFLYFRINNTASQVEWNNIVPYFTDFGFTLAVGGFLTFKAEKVAVFICKKEQAQS